MQDLAGKSRAIRHVCRKTRCTCGSVDASLHLFRVRRCRSTNRTSNAGRSNSLHDTVLSSTTCEVLTPARLFLVQLKPANVLMAVVSPCRSRKLVALGKRLEAGESPARGTRRPTR